MSNITVSGEMYKLGSNSGKMQKRRFILSNSNLIYYLNSELRGNFDLTNSTVKPLNDEKEANSFILESPKRTLHCNCESESSFKLWMGILTVACSYYTNINKRFLHLGEDIIKNGIISKRRNFFFKTNLQMILTNFPRILILDENYTKVIHNIKWNHQDSSKIIISKKNENLMQFSIPSLINNDGKMTLYQYNTEEFDAWFEAFQIKLLSVDLRLFDADNNVNIKWINEDNLLSMEVVDVNVKL